MTQATQNSKAVTKLITRNENVAWSRSNPSKTITMDQTNARHSQPTNLWTDSNKLWQRARTCGKAVTNTMTKATSRTAASAATAHRASALWWEHSTAIAYASQISADAANPLCTPPMCHMKLTTACLTGRGTHQYLKRLSRTQYRTRNKVGCRTRIVKSTQPNANWTALLCPKSKLPAATQTF